MNLYLRFLETKNTRLSHFNGCSEKNYLNPANGMNALSLLLFLKNHHTIKRLAVPQPR